MYILSNALKNIVRNKGRNLLVAAIIFAIIVTTVLALIINNTSSAVIEDYRNQFGSEVSITPDMEKVREEATKNSTNGRVTMRVPTLSPELLLSFAKSDTLQKSVATATISANDQAIKALDQDSSENSSSNNSTNNGNKNTGDGAAAHGGISLNMGSSGNFKVYGDYWQDFNDGNRKLTDGSAFPANDNECVISEDLAELNNITIGDSLTFTSAMTVDIPSGTDTTDYKDGGTAVINGTEYTLSQGIDGKFRASRDAVYTLKVTGIYYDLTDEYANENMFKSAELNRRNEILTTMNTLLDLRKTDENNIRLDVKYYLKNPDLITEFETYVRAAGLSDTFKVSTDAASYDQVVKPVVNLKNISLTFMIVVLILGAIILILLSSISIRERKYEIGVLRAMGMKKSRVALGLWSEIIMITCACLVIGVASGAAIAQPVASTLIKQQAAVVEQSQQNSGMGSERQMFTGGGPAGGNGSAMMGSGGLIRNHTSSNVQPLSEMKVTIGLDTIGEIIAIALSLASIAGLFAISKITKYEPIKILMERN